jgi:hypothetical protein
MVYTQQLCSCHVAENLQLVIGGQSCGLGVVVSICCVEANSHSGRHTVQLMTVTVYQLIVRAQQGVAKPFC